MDHLLTFLKGFAMGAANVIPGVSGGTIAFITGIYERLINALRSFDRTAVRLLLGRKLRELAGHIDLAFLVSLGLGVVVSIVTLAKVLKSAFQTHPTWVGAFFFGLILASIFSVGKMVKRWTAREVVTLTLGLCIAIGLAFLGRAEENAHPAYLLLCGVAGMCSMIVPGISGSFILLLMGNYKLIILDSVNDLRELNFSRSALPVLVPVGIGAVLGLLALSHILAWLFKRYHDAAVSLITGFVAGSLVIIWPWKKALETVTVNGKDKVLPSTARTKSSHGNANSPTSKLQTHGSPSHGSP